MIKCPNCGNTDFVTLLIQALKEQGCEMGYNNSKWYSLAEIEKIARQIQNGEKNNEKNN